MYIEDLKTEPNQEIGAKDFFEMACSILVGNWIHFTTNRMVLVESMPRFSACIFAALKDENMRCVFDTTNRSKFF